MFTFTITSANTAEPDILYIDEIISSIDLRYKFKIGDLLEADGMYPPRTIQLIEISPYIS